MRKGLWFVVLLLGAAGMAAFAAAETEQPAAAAEEPAEIADQTYHWATPAAYQKDTGNTVGEFKEAPILAERVAAGVLPPVAERLPLEPLVLGKKIGTYGGTMFVAGPWAAKTYGAEPYSLYGLAVPQHSWEYNIYPNLAKDIQESEGGSVWTIHLREGTKWSDGSPFTADDILFWWEDVYTMEEAPAFYTRSQKNSGIWKDIRKIDDYTVQFEFTRPTLVLFYVWAGKAVAGFQREYWEQYHPRYADKDELDALVKEEGFESWLKLFAHMTDTGGTHNTERPILLPWVLVQGAPDDIVMKRNAYFWAVDPDGNQLPYIDELYRFSGLDGEVVNLKALAGELDIAGVDFETYSLAKERGGEGEIVAMKYANTTFVEAGLQFNLTHRDPVLRKIFADKRFRFAASHAINREQINQLVYYGLTEPWQAAPWENSVYYHERLAHTALEHDPDKAKALLAEIGLTAGADGVLVRPDGEKLEINLVTYGGRKDRIAELIADDLKAVGVDVNLRAMNGGQAYQLIKGNDLDAIIMGGPGMGGEGFIWTGPYASNVVPVDSFDAAWASLWQQWWVSDGEQGEAPPPELQEALALYTEGLANIDPEVLTANWQRIADIAADNLWTIGTVKSVGYYKIYSSRLENWPRQPLPFDRGGDKGRPSIYFLKS
jgi:peptide/nickel transport system substrate-binding protein